MECDKQWAPRSVCALNNGYWMAYHLFLKEWLRESSSYYVSLFCKYWLLKKCYAYKNLFNNSIRKTKGPNHFQSCLFFQGLFAQKVSLSQLRSLYLSRAVSNFFGTEIEIWANYKQLFIAFFHIFVGKNFFLPMKIWKKGFKKLLIIGPNLNFCSIKIAHRAT